MKSAIEEMLNGERGNLETLRNSEEVTKCYDDVIEWDNTLRDMLKDSPEQLEALSKFQRALDKLDAQAAIDRYKEGFRFGFRLALDVLG